jgi:Mannosylglycerate hydrolase MGH1-like glycoside hydrolase domain
MTHHGTGEELRAGARRVLEASWREADGFCPPNPEVYPHQWLWDSCFHAIAWSALGDPRGARELASCLDGQLESGFVPHMRYLGPSANRGPLADRSSFTQPPVYAHAARVVAGSGGALEPGLVGRIVSALDWLWRYRRTPEGLLYVVHPWETGTDDSPRWDDWVGLPAYDHAAYSAVDRDLVGATYFDRHGAAVWSRSLASAPASFNALSAHAALECAELTGDDAWRLRGEELAALADDLLWDEAEGLWVDRPLIGGGPGCRVPTLDGALGVLVTGDPAKARRVLAQLTDPERFGAPYGPAYLPRGHPSYQPGEYWRGAAWPQLGYLFAVAARRWGDEATYARLRETTYAGVLASGFAEYWNPEDGTGLGAVPQGWAAVAAAL